MESCYSKQRGFLISLFLLNVLIYWKVSGCLDSERKALTTFRKALNDPSNLLSSWDDEASDCCKWRGITCHDITGFVLKLDLHTQNYNRPSIGGIEPAFGLSGRIDPALVELKHLQFLDLSYNTFLGDPIPDFLGSMKELRHLNLSRAGFSGRIPHQLGNLSQLISLKLVSNSLSAKNLWWLTSLPSLKYLRMSYVNLSMASHDWVHVMNNCPSLVELMLSNCGLSYISPTLASVNFTSLRVLDLRFNFNSRFPNWIANISSLVSLSLSVNKFQGQVPNQFSKLPNLEELRLQSSDDSNLSEILEGKWSKLNRLDLSFNQLQGGIPVTIGNITSLVDLDLLFSGKNITGGSIPRAITKLINLERLSLKGYHMHAAIPDWLGELKNLKHLILTDCMLTGQIPAALLGRLPSLEELNLAGNQLNGNIPAALGGLSSLQLLYLHQNKLNGNIPEALGELTSLQSLYLSGNQLNGIIPTTLGQLSNLSWLDLSNNSLIGNVSESHFENLKKLNYLDLSSNNFSGPIPRISNGAIVLLLSNNQFSGPIPPNFASTMHKLEFFSARGNQISGIIPPSLGAMNSLNVLDLSRNNISGVIPLTLGNCVALEALDLSKNRLSGGIPRSLGLLRQLQTMHLSNNALSGKIPLSLKKCASLETLNLGYNNFSGHIPTWIGESLPALRIMSLRSNMFTGNIPPQLFNLTSLQILDVAQNCLSGSIPQSFENLIAMKNEQKMNRFIFYGNLRAYYEENLLVSIKRQMLEYTRTISLVTCMDLSSNNLFGEIPEELTSLLGLHALNLSGNQLTGKIPSKIGKLALLESLDFSKNQLSGSIPLSMSNLNFLSHLNLSYNNLSGRIPSGNQLQTLEDQSIYIGNNGLCGPPLTYKCDSDDTSQGPMPAISGDVEKDEEEYEMRWFYTAMAPGFAMGFWAFCGVLILKKSWRIAYYRFFDEMENKLVYNCCFT